ncbi:MAG: TadE family protein [Verrucomicrobiia bacterium]
MSRRSRSTSPRSRGQTSVEFALIFPIVVLVICAIIDFSWYFYHEAAMSHTIREALRYGVTGRVKENPNYVEGGTEPKFLSRKQSVLKAAEQAAPPFVRLYKKVAEEKIPTLRFYNPDTGDEYPGDNLGGPGARVQAVLRQEVNFITPLPRLLNPNHFAAPNLIEVSTIFKSERYEL